MKKYLVVVESVASNVVASFDYEHEAKRDVEMRIKNGVERAYVAQLLLTAERAVKIIDTRPQAA